MVFKHQAKTVLNPDVLQRVVSGTVQSPFDVVGRLLRLTETLAHVWIIWWSTENISFILEDVELCKDLMQTGTCTSNISCSVE